MRRRSGGQTTLFGRRVAPAPSSISGKSSVDWQAFRAALGDVETLDTPSRVKKRSRDFFWYSPVLSRALSGSFGDLVALPTTLPKLESCIALAVEWNVPIVARGGGSGNYGQAVPMDGGLIIDMTGLDRILEVNAGSVLVEAGCRIEAVNDALKAHGRELPIFPSTQEIATVGGFIAGGSGGIGSITHGMLRDPGNVPSLSVLSIENPPRRHTFEGEAVNAIHHAWGTNGIIAEARLRTVAARDWISVAASFPSYRNAFDAGVALGSQSGFDLKLVTTVDRRIATYFDHLKPRVPGDRDLLFAMVPRSDLESLARSVAASSGVVEFALDDEAIRREDLPHVFEFSYNHTTLQALKHDRGLTYLQFTVPDPSAFAALDNLQTRFGDEVLMHHEFARLDGKLVAFDLPIVRYTNDARLYEIMRIYMEHGCRVSDPHRPIVETGGIRPDYRHLAWKRRLDPHDLLNSAKSHAWQNVKHMSPDDIESMMESDMPGEIPAIDIGPLFGPASPERDRTDAAVLQAASGIGFMTIAGFPGNDLLTTQNRARILRIFNLTDEEKQKLLRWNFDNSKRNFYRGWFPLQPKAVSYKEGIDMGPDVAHTDAAFDPSDPLCERTPLPDDALLAGWRDSVADYYRAMEKVGNTLMRAVARGLDLPENVFDGYFKGGISTLRLIRYPLRDAKAAADLSGPDYTVVHNGEKRTIIGKQHVDSGFVTLLAQDGVEGLQAKNHAGEWIDVPPADGTLAVNFGQLLERWTGGKVRATLHRVIAPKQGRFSIPFFYEPRVDAEITPLPIAGATKFEPFLYGDYLWDAATNFVEMSGIKDLRKPLRAKAS